MLLEFQSVSFRFGEAEILRGVDLTVPAGQRIALLGRSGSGKSTLLRLVNGLLEPTSGRVVVRGRPTDAWAPESLRRGVGYMIQDVGLFPHYTVADNVRVVPRLLGWDAERIEASVQAALDLVGLPLAAFGPRYPRQLSGGQRQRVGVARAIASGPDMLLCDEPFGALDPLTRFELQTEFRDWTRNLEAAVIFVTHDVREARFVADRIALLEEGRIVFDGPVDAFDTSENDTVQRFREATI